MPRRVTLSWHGVRFGLTLSAWASQALGYWFLINAAVMFALAPIVFSRQFFAYVGFGLFLLLVTLFVSILRRSLHSDSTGLGEQIAFLVMFFLVWLTAATYPEIADWLLAWLAQFTPLVLVAAACAAVVGYFCCLTAIGHPITWLVALFACAALIGSFLLLNQKMPLNWLTAFLPEPMDGMKLVKVPILTATVLACIGVLLHGIFLRRTASYFRDISTSDYVSSFLGYHLLASTGLWAGLAWLVSHPVRPILEIGGVTLDAVAVCLSGLCSILISIGSIWLGRCAKGTRAIIDLVRREKL